MRCVGDKYSGSQRLTRRTLANEVSAALRVAFAAGALSAVTPLVQAQGAIDFTATRAVPSGGTLGQYHSAQHQQQHNSGITRTIAPAVNSFHAPRHVAPRNPSAPRPVVATPIVSPNTNPVGFNLPLEVQLGIGRAAAAFSASNSGRSRSAAPPPPPRSTNQVSTNAITQNLASDAFLREELSSANWAPGGKNFPDSFDDRGSLVSQRGAIDVTPTSSQRISDFLLQTVSISGRYVYVNDLDADHPIEVHSPFDITANASGSADNTTDTSEVRVNMQWVGSYVHPEDGYDGGPAGAGARDIFTFDIQGNAAAQYFVPSSGGGGNPSRQPGLPQLPDLPDLPDFGDQQRPSELSGGSRNPYGGPGYYYNNASNNSTYNPYNPPRYINPNYNPYNPNPGFNPYQSIYQPTGAPDTSPYLAIAGGSWQDANNQSQFDISWMTEIQREHGVNDHLDYGSFSSPQSALLNGIVRSTNLTAVNQDALNEYIRVTGITPSTIGTQVAVVGDSPLGIRSFSSQEDYYQKRKGEYEPRPPQTLTPNALGYNTQAGQNPGSNETRVASYESGPLFESQRPGGTPLGSLGVVPSYGDNASSGQISSNSGYDNPAGDVVDYGGATGFDGYDSDAEKRRKDAAAEAKRQEDIQKNLDYMEKRAQQEKALEDLTKSAIELAKADTSMPKPKRPIKIGTNTQTEAERAQSDPTFHVSDEIKEKIRKQEQAKADKNSSTGNKPKPSTSDKGSSDDVDESFKERFGEAEDGVGISDKKGGGSSEEIIDKPDTPREGIEQMYGRDLRESKAYPYLDVKLADIDSVPDEIRNNPDFIRYKLAEYKLANPNGSDSHAQNFLKTLTGQDTQYAGMSFGQWWDAVVNDTTSYEATLKTAGEVKDELSDTVTGVWNFVKSAYNSSDQDKEIAWQAFKEAFVESGLQMNEKIAYAGKFWGDAGSPKALADLQAQLGEEFDANMASLKADFMANPDKYFQGAAKGTVIFAIEEVVTGGTAVVLKHAGKYARLGTVALIDGATTAKNTKRIAQTENVVSGTTRTVRGMEPLVDTQRYGVANNITDKLKEVSNKHNVDIDLQIGNEHAGRLWAEGNILSKPESLKVAKTYNEIDVMINPNAGSLASGDMGKVVLFEPKLPDNFKSLSPDMQKKVQKRYDFRKDNYDKGVKLINDSGTQPYRATDYFPGGAKHADRTDLIYDNGIIKTPKGQQIGRYQDMSLELNDNGIIIDKNTGFAFTGDVDIANITKNGKPLKAGEYSAVWADLQKAGREVAGSNPKANPFQHSYTGAGVDLSSSSGYVTSGAAADRIREINDLGVVRITAGKDVGYVKNPNYKNIYEGNPGTVPQAP